MSKPREMDAKAFREMMKHRTKHKYHVAPANERTVDGIVFASKREAWRYVELCQLRDAGAVLWFLRQVPFHLPGGVKYISDFLVFWRDGRVTVEDCKGVQTETFKVKKRLVEATYPVNIDLK